MEAVSPAVHVEMVRDPAQATQWAAPPLGWGLPLLRILGCEESLSLGDLERQLWVSILPAPILFVLAHVHAWT